MNIEILSTEVRPHPAAFPFAVLEQGKDSDPSLVHDFLRPCKEGLLIQEDPGG